ncbi:OX-2 membrane glycoprotein-like [Rana temporaria]|uniref:OX-2 membrane glycoprotein-like n=1 Tax=Rana temporaria TaxID=8407 RepID=UPI001AAE090E|nr:OX-2 membrane glycoprotein-like [Rana temporaria]
MDWTEGRVIFACFLSYICMTSAVDERIHTEDVQAEFGESATLACLLQTSNDVAQVTWKKIGKDGDTNLATYIKGKGARVDKPYADRLNVSMPGLNRTAITIYKADLEDEGCYVCVFNAFPTGAKEGRVCLTISGEVLIEKNHKVKVGDAVTLRCYLRNPENVTQVSWAKNKENIGIYRDGPPKIEEKYQKMVHLCRETPHVSALTIRKAAISDEGEYKCVFNSFPKGSTHGTTKLRVHSFANHLQPEIITLTLTLVLALLWLWW